MSASESLHDGLTRKEIETLTDGREARLIHTIRMVRERAGLGFVEAKLVVDRFVEANCRTCNRHGTKTYQLTDEALERVTS